MTHAYHNVGADRCGDCGEDYDHANHSNERPPVPGCDLCGDNRGPFFLHAKCHLTAPLKAEIENGVLTLRCYIPECARVVARFVLASEATS